MQSSIILPNYAATVQSSPEKPCVAEGDWRLSYRDVDLLTDNLAFDLATAGAMPGDTVCFVGGAGARRLIFHLAAIKAGYCFCAPILQMGEPYVLELTPLVGPKA